LQVARHREDRSRTELRLDNREIVAAHLASPQQLAGFAVTGAVAAYLGRDVRG
jgi:hypothetical protein